MMVKQFGGLEADTVSEVAPAGWPLGRPVARWQRSFVNASASWRQHSVLLRHMHAHLRDDLACRKWTCCIYAYITHNLTSIRSAIPTAAVAEQQCCCFHCLCWDITRRTIVEVCSYRAQQQMHASHDPQQNIHRQHMHAAEVTRQGPNSSGSQE
jgi:hypothetical protein